MTESAIPTVETPIVPITDPPPNLSRRGMKIGAVVAGRMAAGYATLFTIGIVGREVVALLQGDVYANIGTALGIGVLTLFVGIFPALFIGGVAGEIIGWVLQQRHQPLTFKGAFTVGVGVGILLLFVPNVLIGRELLAAFQTNYVDLTAFVIFWYLPCLFALLGLGWVAHKMNNEPLGDKNYN